MKLTNSLKKDRGGDDHTIAYGEQMKEDLYAHIWHPCLGLYTTLASERASGGAEKNIVVV